MYRTTDKHQDLDSLVEELGKDIELKGEHCD